MAARWSSPKVTLVTGCSSGIGTALADELHRRGLRVVARARRPARGFVHAEVPLGMDWPTFYAALERGDRKVMESALWGRRRIMEGDMSGIPGIGRLFVGHSVQSGGMRRFGNVYAVDTGAIFG